MEKRHAIIESATRLFGSIGFDATTTLEIVDEADVTEPLIYYHFKGKHELFKISLDLAFNEYISRLVELPKHNPTEFQKITNIIDLHFQIVDDLPEQMHMIVTTCPAKLNDPNKICLKNIKKTRQIVVNYISDCLSAGIERGEFRKVPVLPTANMLVALINGLLWQKVYQLDQSEGVKDATIDFCKGSLPAVSAIQ